MESTSLRRILKSLVSAVVFNILVEVWIFIDIAYNIKGIFCVFILLSIAITVFSTKAQRIKKCFFNSLIWGIMCIVIWILIELIKSKLNIYGKLFSFALGAGDGFTIIVIYISSVISVVVGTIISMIISWCWQMHNHSK